MCCRAFQAAESCTQRENYSLLYPTLFSHSDHLSSSCGCAGCPSGSFRSAFTSVRCLNLSKLRHLQTYLCCFEAQLGTKRHSVTQPTDSRPHKNLEDWGSTNVTMATPRGGLHLDPRWMRLPYRSPAFVPGGVGVEGHACGVERESRMITGLW